MKMICSSRAATSGYMVSSIATFVLGPRVTSVTGSVGGHDQLMQQLERMQR